MKQEKPQALTQNDELTQLLSPIIKTIKNKKINSFFQFKHNYSAQNPQSIFSARQEPALFVVGDKSKITKNNNSQVKKTLTRPPATAQKIMRKPQTTYTAHRKFRSDHPIISQKSKLKRHLVASINFKEIENKLYKKRQWATRYENFCDRLKSRKNSTSEKKENKRLSITPNKCQEVSPDSFNYATINVRTTPKKKFWIRQKSNKIKLSNTGYLQGTSFRSISIF